MKALITDAEALNAISPLALKGYALSAGWTAVEPYGDHSQVYIKSGVRSEAIIPGTSEIADYANVIASLLDVFSQAENRDQLQTYRDLVTADKDVIRIRSMRADDDGSVSVGAGVDMVVHARDLVLSAACSAWSPQATYRAGRIRVADEYISKVRLGQTERGSFVVALLSPVSPAIQEAFSGWPAEGEEPFERRVTRRLSGGLDAAAVALERFTLGAGEGVFDSAVARGLSANLCEAAAHLSDRADGIEFSITWARTRPAPEHRWQRVLTRTQGQTLREVARIFHRRAPRPDEHIEGLITKLARDENATEGQVTLRANIDGQWVSVKAELGPREYEIAIAAHRGSVPVTMEGTLVRSGHRWRIDDPHQVKIVEEDEAENDDAPVRA